MESVGKNDEVKTRDHGRCGVEVFVVHPPWLPIGGMNGRQNPANQREGGEYKNGTKSVGCH
jgi:hypothetical protein